MPRNRKDQQGDGCPGEGEQPPSGDTSGLLPPHTQGPPPCLVPDSLGDNPEDCPVCLTAFDDSVQRPRTLPCGHTVCTLCTDKLKEQGRVTCVECRASHAVPEGGQFPVCYTIEAFVRRLRVARVAPAPAAAAAAALQPPCAGKGKGVAGAAGKKGAAGLSKKMRSFLQEQHSSVVAAITACQKARSQLQQYRATLTGWREQQQQLEDRLQALVDQSQGARERLQQEESRAAVEEEEVTKREQQLQAVQEPLHTPATEQEAGVAVAAVFSCLEEAEQEVEKCRQCFPDASTVTAARKVREASSAALEAARAVQAALEAPAPGTAEEPQPHPAPGKNQPHPAPGEPQPQPAPGESQPQPAPDSTIMERLQLILGGSLRAEDLLSQTQPALSLLQAGRVREPALRLLQAGRVFAVQQVEGQRRHARISLEAGRLYLHALKEQPPPEGAATLQMSEVVPPSPPCTVFLDLSWPGRSPRRVQIRLSPDTPRGRVFVMLCTGQRGPSYVSTSLFVVYNKGTTGEFVCGGDYERYDGRGSCLLLPGLDQGEYRRSGRAGAVCGWVSDDPARGVCGKFAIITRNCVKGVGSSRVFGKVVAGLNVVAEAAHHSDIKEVTVVDCGVVL